MGRRSIGIALAVVVAFTVGCGETPPVETVTDTATVTAEQDEPTRARKPGTTDGGGPASGPTERVEGLTGFSSPTGNIGCAIDDESARCDVGEYDWQPPPKPASCDYDWGGSVNVTGDRPGQVGCISDTARGAEKVLPYGESIQSGSFRCTSAEDGMTCENLDSGHGFFLARETYRVF